MKRRTFLSLASLLSSVPFIGKIGGSHAGEETIIHISNFGEFRAFEDFSDVIYRIEPQETPFMKMMNKTDKIPTWQNEILTK